MCTAGSHLNYIYNIYFMDKKKVKKIIWILGWPNLAIYVYTAKIYDIQVFEYNQSLQTWKEQIIGKIRRKKRPRQSVPNSLSNISQSVSQSYSGQIQSYLGQIRSYLGQIQSYFGPIHSYFGQIQSNLGQIQSYLGQIQSYLGQIQSYLGPEVLGAPNFGQLRWPSSLPRLWTQREHDISEVWVKVVFPSRNNF